MKGRSTTDRTSRLAKWSTTLSKQWNASYVASWTNRGATSKRTPIRVRRSNRAPQRPDELTFLRVLFGAKKMQRNVRLIANDPAVVRYRRDVKELSRSQLDDASIIECSRRGSGEHQSNVLNVAPNRAHARAGVLAPLPPCFISGATNRYRAEMHQFEATFLHHANFVRRVKGFENNGYLVAAHA